MKIKTKKANAKDALKAEEIAEEKCWTRYCTASVEEAELDLMKATMTDQGEARLACFGLMEGRMLRRLCAIQVHVECHSAWTDQAASVSIRFRSREMEWQPQYWAALVKATRS